MTVAVQASEQLALRWGTVGRDVLRAVFPSVLLLTGCSAERAIVEQAAWAEGERESWQRSYSDGPAGERVQRSARQTAAVQAADLLPTDVGHGRLIVAGRPGPLVELPDISSLRGA